MTQNNSSHSSQSSSSKKVDHKGSLSAYQVYVLVVLTIIGAPLLTYPRFVSNIAGNDGVWLNIVAGLLVSFVVYLISKLCQRFAGQTFVHFIPEIFGTGRMKWFGKAIASLIMIIFALHWMTHVSFQARLFSEATSTSMLPNTPIEATILTLLIASTFASCSRPSVIGMLNEILFPLILVPFFLQLYVIFQRGEIIHLLPLFQSNWPEMGKGLLASVLGFSGFEVLLLIMGYSQKIEESAKVNTRAMITTVILLSSTVVAQYSVFGAEELSKSLWSTLDFFKEGSSELLLLERIEAFVLGIWLAIVFTTVTNLQFVLVRTICEAFQIKEKQTKYVAWSLLPFFYGIAMIPENISEFLKVYQRYSEYGILFAFTTPIILLLVAVIRRKRSSLPKEERKGGENQHGTHHSSSSS